MKIQLRHIILSIAIIVAQSAKSQGQNDLDSLLKELAANNKRIKADVLTVPENHDNPNGKQLTISYAIIKAKTEVKDTDFPLIYLTGGPGGSALTKARIDDMLARSFGQNRDIILFDQRGVGLSSGLPTMSESIYQLLAKDYAAEQELQAMSQLLVATKKGIEDAAISLADYNTFQNARDVGLLMKKLGYKRYNLMGASYGTTLGRLVQDYYPDLLHATIYNAPSPIDINFLVSRLHSYELALNRIFDWCTNDNTCATTYPKLQKTYVEAIETLQSDPIVVPMTEGSFVINSQDALYLIRRFLYANSSKRIVPLAIQALKTKNLNLLRNIILLERRVINQLNMSMFLAVSSYEQTDPHISQSYIDSIYTTLNTLPTRMGFFDALYRSGKDWHGKKASFSDRHYQPSKVPTLVISNYYDPVTPPENGRLFMEALQNGQLFVLDEGGHGSFSNPSCLDQLFGAFMDHPEQDLDVSCLQIYRD